MLVNYNKRCPVYEQFQRPTLGAARLSFHWIHVKQATNTTSVTQVHNKALILEILTRLHNIISGFQNTLKFIIEYN